MNDKTLTELIRVLLADATVTPTLRDNIERAINPDCVTVPYYVEDMVAQIEHKNDVLGEKIYSTENAREALEAMCYNHDMEYGITFYTIEHFIDEYCRIDSEGR